MDETEIDPVLLSVLACPDEHHAPVREEKNSVGEPVLTCIECGRSYPIRDGIPVMLLDEATEPGSGASA